MVLPGQVVFAKGPVVGLAISFALWLSTAAPARSQVPGLPAPAPPADAGKDKPKPGATTEKAKAAVAAPEGPISVDQNVSDFQLRRFLDRFLPKYPGVRYIKVNVDDGVITLEGQVDTDDTYTEISEVVKRVEGARLVLNRLHTDEDVMTAWQYAVRDLDDFLDYFRHSWLLIILSVLVVIAAWLLARTFSANAEWLLAPVVKNPLLRSVVASAVSSLLIIGGLIVALGMLRLTRMVVSVLGVSGLVVLAIGFAFRDITENFIASVLLGLRRPFQIGDYLTIAGQSGVVKSLNTRATVLVTFEGKHVRIPNSTMFKEIMINSTASPSFRSSFEVVVPYEASTAAAIEAIGRALRETPGAMADPPPRALVEALEPGGVRLRAEFWSPTHNVDWFQLMSDVKLRAKVGLQQAGVIAAVPKPAPGPAKTGPDSGTGPAVGPGAGRGPGEGATTAAAQAAANLRRDARAAANAPSAIVDADRPSPVEQALQHPENHVSEEGTNLLKTPDAEPEKPVEAPGPDQPAGSLPRP